MPLEGSLFVHFAEVPDAYGTIEASGGELRGGGRKGQGSDGAGVSSEGAKESVVGGVEEADGVFRSEGDEGAVGGDVHGVDGSLIEIDVQGFFVVGDGPVDEFAVEAGRDEHFAAADESEVGDGLGVFGEDSSGSTGGDVPEVDLAGGVAGSQPGVVWGDGHGDDLGIVPEPGAEFAAVGVVPGVNAVIEAGGE